jgi:hypothetical protein
MLALMTSYIFWPFSFTKLNAEIQRKYTYSYNYHDISVPVASCADVIYMLENDPCLCAPCFWIYLNIIN